MSRPDPGCSTSGPGRIEVLVGRWLLAGLFFAGAVQKVFDPSTVTALLEGFALPGFLVWPAAIYNLAAAILLASGTYVIPVARSLAIYCIVTSFFHLIPSDGWQMSIFVKNWAIAGGLLALSAAERASLVK
uniref:DoxX family protein n=1 Tax=Pararhizobium sp. IMCC3301 TaxID=3067904 RepID=UPI002741746A|nr:DoxX family protein [Pararhizobium sp. IMCC3301]